MLTDCADTHDLPSVSNKKIYRTRKEFCSYCSPASVSLNPNDCVEYSINGQKIYSLTNLSNTSMTIHNPLIFFHACQRLDTYFNNNTDPKISPDDLEIFTIYNQMHELVNLVLEQNTVSFNKQIIDSYIQKYTKEITDNTAALIKDNPIDSDNWYYLAMSVDTGLNIWRAEYNTPNISKDNLGYLGKSLSLDTGLDILTLEDHIQNHTNEITAVDLSQENRFFDSNCFC